MTREGAANMRPRATKKVYHKDRPREPHVSKVPYKRERSSATSCTANRLTSEGDRGKKTKKKKKNFEGEGTDYLELHYSGRKIRSRTRGRHIKKKSERQKKKRGEDSSTRGNVVLMPA